jgi:DNA-binding transcriptional ArsR family regulator
LDSFAAVAEPRRREMLGLLAFGERPVNDMVHLLGWPQPQVSKHLSVLLQVGLVNVRREGRQRVYSVNGDQLKPIHDWVSTFERFWQHQLNQIKARAEQKAKHLPTHNQPHPKPKE